MALQGSGQIKMSEIQAEFGGANPISLSEYYGAAPGIPGSGMIKMSDFYGKSSHTDPGAKVFNGANELGTQITWTVPNGYNGIDSICVLCIGGGGAGGAAVNGGGGGGGGALTWVNNIACYPGEQFELFVGPGGGGRVNGAGANGAISWFKRKGASNYLNIAFGGVGGGGGAQATSDGGAGGAAWGDGSGSWKSVKGGDGGDSWEDYAGGGGGAAGWFEADWWSGHGGSHRKDRNKNFSGQAGKWGGGGGGGITNYNFPDGPYGMSGGGTGWVYTEAGGAGGGWNDHGKGSGGGDGSFGSGGVFGGGGGGSSDDRRQQPGASGAQGIIRIVWGTGIALPG